MQGCAGIILRFVTASPDATQRSPGYLLQSKKQVHGFYSLTRIKNRFGFAISSLAISGENQTAAKGRIMDADFAMETANLSRAQILQQAGNAMVAQANQSPQQVMALLRN